MQCSSQSAPLRESHKRSRDGPHQKRSRTIMALSFFNFLGLKKCLCYFNYDNFPIKQNFEISKEQGLRTFVHNMKINRWIFLSLPDLPWVVWRPLSLDLAFVISQELMGIHHGVSKKSLTWQTRFRDLSKVFSQWVTKKWMEAKQFRRSERKQILTVKWKMRWKKLLTIFIAYILIVLFALLPKISSIVYKEGCSMSASNKLPFSFP